MATTLPCLSPTMRLFLYSSADDDRQWVHWKLVPQLEKQYAFCLCIHHRDFMAGRDIADNIELPIQQSRKVLVIMSPNFLISRWCSEEVEMTNNLDPTKLIVIMYKDVLLVHSPIPPLMQHLLENRTYIKWYEEAQGQSLFWKKTRKALYNKHMMYSQHDQPVVLSSSEQMLLKL